MVNVGEYTVHGYYGKENKTQFFEPVKHRQGVVDDPNPVSKNAESFS